jgi:colanic acid/amylovoran biosynthesis protein
MEKFCNLRNSIAIIPNKKMISHGGNNVNKYLKLMIGIVNFFMNKGHNVFLLNHEAEGDLKMCEIINSKVENPLEIVSGLSAKEVKGLIGISRLVVSSRFHGVASALSQGVPCLATSWNHKYKMIFEDFGQKECILNSSDPLVLNLEKISSVYDNSTVISSQLRSNKEVLIAQIDQMWDKIIENFESTI